MAWFLRDNGEKIETEQLTQTKLEALHDPTRQKILKQISKKPSYPSKIAEKLEISKQKAHYHFKLLKQKQLIKKVREEKKSGGVANFYKPRKKAYTLDLGGKGEKTSLTKTTKPVKQFLTPFVKKGEIKTKIVTGSPERHGPNQVRGQDGHLAAEIALKIGEYGTTDQQLTTLDTELVQESNYNHNMILLGGILTNTTSKKYNKKFPANFEGKQFPYRKIKTPNNTYKHENIGTITKTEHPQNEDKSIIMIAGIRNQGTKAAVQAFKNLENLIKKHSKKNCHIIIKGKDMDGDGKIDSYETVEKQGVK